MWSPGLFILMIAVGTMALGKGFRLYSIATILAVLIFGALTAMDAPNVETNEPTPWLGVKERITVFGSMVWMAVLAILLRRAAQGTVAADEPRSG